MPFSNLISPSVPALKSIDPFSSFDNKESYVAVCMAVMKVRSTGNISELDKVLGP